MAHGLIDRERLGTACPGPQVPFRRFRYFLRIAAKVCLMTARLVAEAVRLMRPCQWVLGGTGWRKVERIRAHSSTASDHKHVRLARRTGSPRWTTEEREK